jgi:CheY-like chemotaxis protein
VTSSGVAGDALAAIWERHRDVVLARLDTIELASTGEGGTEAREEAVRAAHQLAGTVGTFGFAHATELARELETRLRGPGAATEELSALARELRRELTGDLGGAGRIAEPRERSGGRVLAVDDDPLILDSLRSLLAEAGIDVLTEGDPCRVIARLPKIAPDLVLLDVDMPGLNGIELCRRIRADPDHRDLPIVFLTTHTDTKTVQAAYRAGADGHLTKPLVVSELVAYMARHQLMNSPGIRQP